MHAARNIRLCTKDCVCLFVCPTGATDTETGQIDFEKCLDGCRLCVDACPSHAIYLVNDNYAPPQIKGQKTKAMLLKMAENKAEQEKIAAGIAREAKSPEVRQLAKALEVSSRISTEDCLREAGYMLPQGAEVKQLLRALLNSPHEDLPKETIQRLLDLL
jgi:Fe-S-cluster-containing hydrogenase component 2